MSRPLSDRPTGAGGGQWYRVENRAAADASTATLVWLMDELGAWGVTAADFVRDLQAIRGDIELHVSSPGGEVFDGIAIFNALRNHRGKVTVYIDGVAASAASFICMAGDRIIAERTATMMIHDAMGIAVGNATDMRDMADLLEKCSQNIASIYAERAGGTQDEWRKRMQAETWFTAAEAKAAGLVDEIVSATPNRNRAPTPTDGWDLSVFRYAGRDHAPAPSGAAVEAHLRAHLPAAQPNSAATQSPADAPGFSLPDVRDALESLNEIEWDPDLFTAAVTIVAHNSPAPPPAPPAVPEDPEPELSINLPDFRRAIREAHL